MSAAPEKGPPTRDQLREVRPVVALWSCATGGSHFE